MGHIKNILVVCTGNACRSPMAEGFLKAYLDEGAGYHIYSAGISAVPGLPPTSMAVQVMKEQSVDISFFCSSPFTRTLAESADLILVMARHHKDLIVESMPEIKDKVFLYNEFAGLAGQDKDIYDPIGQPIDVYRDICSQIKAATEKIVYKIKY
jgi:protein-tyrosine-phosphatase